ncbi:MAG: T9SS C-terminal target domain-containing protein [Calditrichaeota bacterium]|nr:MAG: T9SS C-terminal target domain-containing protein [Calditrichota bacterium]
MKRIYAIFSVLLITGLLIELGAQEKLGTPHQPLKKKLITTCSPELLENFVEPEGLQPLSHLNIDMSNLNHTQITEPVHFPYQNPNYFYSESSPVILANGNILMVWASQDTIYGSQSLDGGLTWNPQTVINSGVYAQYLSTLKTNTGRVLVVWRGGQGLEMIYSDDNGFSWSSSTNITFNSSDRRNSLSQTQDGTIWLFYSRYESTTGFDIFYRTSNDDGITWSSEQIFAQSSSDEVNGTVVSGFGNTLIAVYDDDSSGNYNIYLRTSNDGGVTWSASVPVLNSTYHEYRPRLLRRTDGVLWLIYQFYQPPPSFLNFIQSDLYYIQSYDGGNTWTTPVQFTHYVGQDGNYNVDLLNNQPFVSFSSGRWAPYITYYWHFWYGIIGITQDTNPPPVVLSSNISGLPTQNEVITIQAYVDDESGIANVQLSYKVNGNPFGPIQMYDDGMHNDENAGDNIWATYIGPFQLSDHITYSSIVTDISANIIDVQLGTFEIIPIHHVGNLILSLRETSEIGDPSGREYSAYWPRQNGNTYLYDGGLWIGTQIQGDSRVMNYHYFPEDWKQTSGSITTISPGLSDQDIRMWYDDQFASTPPIGLQVHQKSYQWSDSTRDDFVIITYTIYNTGINGNLTDLFVAVWLDPDVFNYYDDLGGYDNQRGLIYMYDSQGNPGGYIGLKLLGSGNTPHTATIYGAPLPFNDTERYQYMTSGFPPIPTDPADYRLLLTAQPFNLTVGDSQTVAFGIVMGDGLADLQANADTMEAVYNGVLVGIEQEKIQTLPKQFSLRQNYPNPFNPVTNVEFGLPHGEWVTLKVYDLLGREVKTLVNRRLSAGYHTVQWDGTNDAGQPVASGVYLYRLTVGQASLSNVQTRKMVLLR